MPDVRQSDHELRRCDDCGYEYVRPANLVRVYPEMPCHGCHSINFTVYDPLWVERGINLTINPEELRACLPTS